MTETSHGLLASMRRQRQQLQQLNTKGEAGSRGEHIVGRGRVGASLFNSRDAFAGTKLTENHMKVAKAHCAKRHSKVTEVGEG